MVPGAAFPTGVFLVVILLVMTVCSMKWVRKGGYFEVSLKLNLKWLKTNPDRCDTLMCWLLEWYSQVIVCFFDRWLQTKCKVIMDTSF